MNEITQLSEHLFLSNWETSNNTHVLKKYNIKAVLTIETRPKPYYILKYYANNNINYGFVYLPDMPSANIKQFFDYTYKFIDDHIQKGENVLVHCWAGISRSVAIILNYILKKYYMKYKRIQTMDPENAIISTIYNIRKFRPIINPNQGFLDQLKNKCYKYKRGIWTD